METILDAEMPRVYEFQLKMQVPFETFKESLEDYTKR